MRLQLQGTPVGPEGEIPEPPPDSILLTYLSDSTFDPVQYQNQGFLFADVYIVGGGGGGGGGGMSSQQGGSARQSGGGGGGGGGGALRVVKFNLSALTSPVQITVGAGGTKGATAPAGSRVVATPGGAGGMSSFDTYKAYGGGGGGAGGNPDSIDASGWAGAGGGGGGIGGVGGTGPSPSTTQQLQGTEGAHGGTGATINGSLRGYGGYGGKPSSPGLLMPQATEGVSASPYAPSLTDIACGGGGGGGGGAGVPFFNGESFPPPDYIAKNGGMGYQSEAGERVYLGHPEHGWASGGGGGGGANLDYLLGISGLNGDGNSNLPGGGGRGSSGMVYWQIHLAQDGAPGRVIVRLYI